MSRWFHDYRVRWIIRTVERVGAINRRDVTKKFGVSHQCASDDLADAMARQPRLMAYNRSTKQYERGGEQS